MQNSQAILLRAAVLAPAHYNFPGLLGYELWLQMVELGIQQMCGAIRIE